VFFRAAGYVTNLNESKPVSKTKLNIIQPSLGLVRLSDGDLLSRTNAVHDGMVDNTAYPSPPVSMRDFKAALDAYTAAVAATLDGGKSATVARDKCRAEVIIMLRLLGHYVEGACKNDMATFLSSGFVPASTAHQIPQPLSAPSAIRIDQGNSGQLLVRIEPVAKARTYELRYARFQAVEATMSWIKVTVASTKPPVPINNLSPGSIYTFQARAFGQLGFSDWSTSVERMCI